MRVEIALPDAVRAEAIDTALAGLQALAELELAGGGFPPVYQSGVRYRREPRGSERWQTPSQTLQRGEGDCEDLAAWRAAELRVSGEDPAARAVVVRSGPRTWHAVVARGDGSFEDPSAALGMSHTESGIPAPVRFAMRPGTRDYRARVAIATPGGQWVHERADECPSCTLRGLADDIQSAAQSVGFIPGLDQLATGLFRGIASAFGGGQPQPPPPPPPRPAAPVVVPAGPVQITPPGPPMDPVEKGVIDLAIQLRRLIDQAKRRELRLR
jgi:hypothetical protein